MVSLATNKQLLLIIELINKHIVHQNKRESQSIFKQIIKQHLLRKQTQKFQQLKLLQKLLAQKRQLKLLTLKQHQKQLVPKKQLIILLQNVQITKKLQIKLLKKLLLKK